MSHLRPTASSSPSMLAAALFLLLGAAAAVAEEPPSAELLHEQATRLFEEGRYREAIALYERSLARYGHMNTLYALGEAHRRLGRLRRSHGYYQRYAQRLTPAERAAFSAKLRQLRLGTPARLTVRCVGGPAAVAVDGVSRGRTSARGALELSLPGGRHFVTVSRAGHRPVARVVVAEFGEPQQLRIALEPLPPPAPLSPQLFAELLGGLRLIAFGDATLQHSPAADFMLRGGVLFRGARWGAYAQLLVSVAPIIDEVVDDTAALTTVLAGGGIRLWPWPRVWIDAGCAVGPALLVDAAPGTFLLDATAEPRTLAGLAIWPAASVGWDVTSALTLSLYPAALSYSPRVGGFDRLAPRIAYLLRYQLLVGVSWRVGL